MLTPEEIAFVQQNLNEDIQKLWLKYGRDKAKLIQQIEARQKAKYKLPTWYANPSLFFPPPISVEQSSSEITASYKADLIRQSTQNQSIADATGGMGIDTHYFSKVAKETIFIEKNEVILQSARYNFTQLNAHNIACIQADSTEFLANHSKRFDWIYIDPSRRDTTQNRVFKLADCEPNVVQHLSLYQQLSSNVLIKVSPLLDIAQILREIPYINTIHIVAVENDCKELLLEINKSTQTTTIKTIHFRNTQASQVFEFAWEEESQQTVAYSLPLAYIYIPNVAMMKSGGFKSIAAHYGLYKIAPHSHIYTSNNIVPNFAGRIFMLNNITKIDAKSIEPYLIEGKANIAIRNFPATAVELRKRLKISDGGNVYIWATTLLNGDKRLLICRKISQ